MLIMEFNGERAKELLDYIINLSENTNAVVKEIDGKRIGIIVGERHYARTFTTVSYSILFLQSSATTCEVYTIGAGGSSKARIDLGAQRDLEERIAKSILENALNSLGLENTLYKRQEKTYYPFSKSIFDYHIPSDK